MWDPLAKGYREQCEPSLCRAPWRSPKPLQGPLWGKHPYSLHRGPEQTAAMQVAFCPPTLQDDAQQPNYTLQASLPHPPTHPF